MQLNKQNKPKAKHLNTKFRYYHFGTFGMKSVPFKSLEQGSLFGKAAQTCFGLQSDGD